MIQNDTKLYCVQIDIINLYIVKRKRQLIQDKKLHCKYVLKRIMLYQQRPFLATDRNRLRNVINIFIHYHCETFEISKYQTQLSVIFIMYDKQEPFATLKDPLMNQFVYLYYCLIFTLSIIILFLRNFPLTSWLTQSHTYMLCLEINYIYLLTIVYSQFKVMNAFGVLVFQFPFFEGLSHILYLLITS